MSEWYAENRPAIGGVAVVVIGVPLMTVWMALFMKLVLLLHEWLGLP